MHAPKPTIGFLSQPLILVLLRQDLGQEPVFHLFGVSHGRFTETEERANLRSMVFNTPADAAKAGAITWNYGNFITLLINFLIVAAAIFLLVRVINQLRHPAVKEPDTKDCPACAMKIPLKATRCPHCTSELSPAAAH